MKIRYHMMAGSLRTIDEGDDLALATEIMLWAGVRHLPVLRDEQVVGVLSDGDVVAHRAKVGNDGSRILVRDAMSAPVEVAGPDDDLADAAVRMATLNIGCLPILDEGQLVGILTTMDLLAAYATRLQKPSETGGLPVSAVMTVNPETARGDESLLYAASRMLDAGVRHLPVVDAEDRVIGILSDRDLRTSIGDPSGALADETARSRIRELRVWAAMTEAVMTVQARAPVFQVISLLIREQIGAVPVVDSEDRLVGIVSYVDILRAISEPRPPVLDAHQV